MYALTFGATYIRDFTVNAEVLYSSGFSAIVPVRLRLFVFHQLASIYKNKCYWAQIGSGWVSRLILSLINSRETP